MQAPSDGITRSSLVSGSLIVIREKAITAKIKMLLWKRRHCTRGGKPVAPWSNPVEVKLTTEERLF